ncbi:MAG: FHA domain-containing protein [Chthoniobacterales bacterium]
MITTGAGTVAHELAEDLVSLGRSPENAIVIDDPSVSSRHALLQAAGEDYLLKDLGSTNGTRVNGQVIESVTLRGGDRVRFGKVEARFESEHAGEAQPLPVLAEVESRPAEVSARPADFANASPFPNRKTPRDPMRTAIFAAAGVAVLAFAASMLALAQMHPPSP